MIVANHPSALDPLFLAAAVPERVLFIAAEEFLSLPAVGWVMRTYGCITVRRGEVDAGAVREALLALAAGRKVVVFPEGGVSPQPGQSRRGAALLAARARVPVVPVAMIGTGRVFPLGARLPRPARVTVRVGPPLPAPPPNRAQQDRITAEAMLWVHAQTVGGAWHRSRTAGTDTDTHRNSESPPGASEPGALRRHDHKESEQ